MKILKVKAYQLFANYRKPLNFNFWDTYPLPPLSTVKGWFHSVIDAHEYIPLTMSIQGTFSSILYDMQTFIKFDRIRKDKEQVKLDWINKALNHSPVFVATVFDINLNIYLYSEDNEALEKFRQNVARYSFPSIGRHEDIARVDFVDFIESEEVEFSLSNSHELNYGIYLSKRTADYLGIRGIHYRMNNKYEIRSNLRYFEKVDVVYADNGLVYKGKCLFDKEEGRIIDLL